MAELRLRKSLRGLRITCQQRLLDMLSSEDEDDIVSSDEEDEHNAWNLFPEVAQSRSAKSFEHASGRSSQGRGAYKDSSEVSSINGYLVA